MYLLRLIPYYHLFIIMCNLVYLPHCSLSSAVAFLNVFQLISLTSDTMATGKINAQLLGVKVQLPCQQNRHQRRQHNTKKHKSSCKEISPPEVQMNLHEFIGLDCNNRRVCRTLHYSIPSSHIYRNNGNFS